MFFYNAITLVSEYEKSGQRNNGISRIFHSILHWQMRAIPSPAPTPPTLLGTFFGLGCGWVDPNPLGHLDGQGHNYFRSQNPYRLNSMAGFGEASLSGDASM